MFNSNFYEICSNARYAIVDSIESQLKDEFEHFSELVVTRHVIVVDYYDNEWEDQGFVLLTREQAYHYTPCELFQAAYDFMVFVENGGFDERR